MPFTERTPLSYDSGGPRSGRYWIRRERYGPGTPVLIVRSPGRVNVMGRHIDHQGGNCNLMTIGYETLMVVHARARRPRPACATLDRERFRRPRRFPSASWSADLPWDDWLSLVNSDKVSAMVPHLRRRLVAVRQGRRPAPAEEIPATDRCAAWTSWSSGNIPMAAGLSSSSSLVVATAEATWRSTAWTPSRRNSWTSAARANGSWARAAAAPTMPRSSSGERGKVIRVGLFRFRGRGDRALSRRPRARRSAIRASGAQKTVNAKDQFNHRIACYHLGFRLIRRSFPSTPRCCSSSATSTCATCACR